MGNWNCATCPAAQPQSMSMCQDGGLQCDYADAHCACFQGSWHCNGNCPTAQPQPGAACNTGMQQCAYGGTTCVCLQGQFFCN
jgi:hypothetical protein